MSANASSVSAPPIRVLVVDDQPLIRRGLAMMLATEPGFEVVGQAADGGEAIECVRREHPDVVLMDLQMPNVGGIAATRTITAEPAGTQVVVLTTFDTDELVFDAIRAGAQAYLLKDAPESEVLETIRAVHRGESRLAPHIARKVMEEFRRLPAEEPAARAPEPPAAAEKEDLAPGPDALTPREERILALLAEGKSNREIARAAFLAEGTVKNYVSRIMEKLHARTRTELAVKALRGRPSGRTPPEA
jgi:DNA-binding NarL/FixJ family response regulator